MDHYLTAVNRALAFFGDHLTKPASLAVIARHWRQLGSADSRVRPT